MNPLRVFIADDHDLVRQGLRQVLEAAGEFVVVGEATNGRQVLDAEALADADVLLLDLSLPKVQGGEVLRRVRVDYPHLRVVILSMYPAEQYAGPLLAAGATAYVSKSRPSREILDVLRKLRMGGPPPTATETKPAAGTEALSPREHQIMVDYVNGATVTEIAAELDVNSCTISNHLAKIRSKLGLRTNVDIVHHAHRTGLIAFPKGR